MESIYRHYKNRLQQTSAELSGVKKNIYLLGSLRLFVFIACAASAFLLRMYGTGIVLLVLLAGSVAFMALLLRYNKRQKRKHYLETSGACDESELKGLDYDFSAFDGAPEKIDSSHFFSLDLDIFGKNSLFQSINRTCTNYGKKVLIAWFEKPLQEVSVIRNRQEAVKELREKESLLHHFRVLGLVNPGKDTDFQEIEVFANRPMFISFRKMWKTISYLLPCLWAAVIVCASFRLTSFIDLTSFYIIALAVSESLVKKVNFLQDQVGKKVNILHSYSNLIETIEKEECQSAELSELKSRFFKNGQKASFLFKQLARLAGDLEQRSNFLVRIILNPLLLWDIRKSIRIDEWKEKNGAALLQWIKTLGEWDAYCSLGTFAFNHPDYTFPAFTDTYFKIKGRASGHPLMNRKTFVRNDIDIEKKPFFMIVTGANMAGKSTYLRTIGVNYVLGCIGAPVCAESLTLYPARLVTSLRTSDSLLDNESYFFAELKRLKMIIDLLQSGEKLFIILDEILKGTNSVDKQKGSLALVRQFVRLQSCGIIATHDLLLGHLEKEFPENIRNHRFEADIQKDELTFSYQMQPGVAQNMNACFLMEKMGITVNEEG